MTNSAAEPPAPPRLDDAARGRHAFSRRIDCDGVGRTRLNAAPARGAGMRDHDARDPLRSARG
jgi:hypothetical protein